MIFPMSLFSVGVTFSLYLFLLMADLAAVKRLCHQGALGNGCTRGGLLWIVPGARLGR